MMAPQQKCHLLSYSAFYTCKASVCPQPYSVHEYACILRCLLIIRWITGMESQSSLSVCDCAHAILCFQEEHSLQWCIPDVLEMRWVLLERNAFPGMFAERDSSSSVGHVLQVPPKTPTSTPKKEIMRPMYSSAGPPSVYGWVSESEAGCLSL